MTRLQSLMHFLSTSPRASNAEILEHVDISPDVLRAYLSRLSRQGRIVITTLDGGGREILVNLAEAKSNFKQDTLQMMIETYMQDFEAAELYTERIEIGKLILRILEKL